MASRSRGNRPQQTDSKRGMTREEVDQFERLQGQLASLYEEVQALAKKSPNDALNKFKLGFVNACVKRANEFLGDERKPFSDFAAFDAESLPTNSDVLVILSQYLSALEKIRADNITELVDYWYWMIDGESSEVRTAPPKKIAR